MKHKPGKQNPPAPLDYNVGGFRATNEVRLRRGLFGFAIVEEKIQYADGRVMWRRMMVGQCVKLRSAE